jgi:hypothetical protein
VNDLERRLRDSLKAVGDSYGPADEAGARARFLQRRRRRKIAWSAGGAALAGTAAVAFFLMPQQARDTQPEERAAVGAGAVRSIAVGGEPVGIVYGHGAMWATDRDLGRVLKIDPAAGAVVATVFVSDAPDDVVVAGGSVWVIDSTNDVLIEIDPATTAVVDEFPVPGSGGHLDVAASDDALWLLEEGRALHRLDLQTGRFSEFALEDDPTDVAVAAGKLWVYARAAGELRPLDLATAAPSGPAALVGRAGDVDVAAGNGTIWFYGDADGKLVRVDASSGEVSDEVTLGGAYGSIAVGDSGVWAIVGDGAGSGVLHGLTPGTLQTVGPPVRLDGRPMDVALGGGFVWVTNSAAGSVTRVGLVDAAPGEVAEPEPRGTGIPIADVVLFFSDGRDVLGLLRDGTERRIASTAAAELAPSVAPDGASLVLQRGVWDPTNPGEIPVVVAVDLATGDERELGSGVSPALAPDGKVAWGVPAPGRTGAEPEIVVTEPGDGAPATYGSPVAAPGNLSWSADGRRVLFDGGDEIGTSILDVDEGTLASIGGAYYERSIVFSPVEEEDGIYVLRTCCRTGAGDETFETLVLGRFTGGSFTRIKGVDDFGLDPNSQAVSLASAGGLDYEADDGWNRYDERSWLLSDGTTLLLVDENGEADRIPVDAALDVAVNPAYTD